MDANNVWRITVIAALVLVWYAWKRCGVIIHRWLFAPSATFEMWRFIDSADLPDEDTGPVTHDT